MKKIWLWLAVLLPLAALGGCVGAAGGPGGTSGAAGIAEADCSLAGSSGQPAICLNAPFAGATQLSGSALNIDPDKAKVVVYALTNEWYVQPTVAAPFTDISADGSWTSSTNPWSDLVVLLVDPALFSPAATQTAKPAMGPGVLAAKEYPTAGAITLDFSGQTWGIKTTDNVPGVRLGPGPNYWTNDSSVVNVAADGLHLKIASIDGRWQCGEVYLLESLGYGTYTVQVSSLLDRLDRNTVAAALFLYAPSQQELDNEYSGEGGLVPRPDNAQFVVQPSTVPGNVAQYVQPSSAQFTSQIEWRADHVTFRAWNGWTNVPADSDMIHEWTYSGAYIPPLGQERAHINLWLLKGLAPTSGVGDEMVINSFTFQP